MPRRTTPASRSRSTCAARCVPLRLGKHDPTDRLHRRRRDAAGQPHAGGPGHRSASSTSGDRLEVEAWGDGAEWALEQAPASLGLLDDRAGLRPGAPGRRSDLHRDGDGLRLPRTDRVVEALVPAILSQRVTGFEAKRAYRQLVERWGEPAPGPGGLRLHRRPAR